MNIIDEEFDEQIEAEARQKLAEALDTLAQKYSQVVKEVARERRRELGQESNYADFSLARARSTNSPQPVFSRSGPLPRLQQQGLRDHLEWARRGKVSDGELEN